MEPRPWLVAQDVLEHREIPRDRGTLRRPRPRPETEHGRNEALGGLGAGRLLGVLRMVDHRQAEHPGIEQRAPQERTGPDRRAVVGEADDAGIGELADRREGLAHAADAHGAIRQDRHRRTGGRSGRPHPRDDPRLVGGRRRVRHRADGREAAVRRRREPGRDRLGVLVAGLAEVDVEVDEAGRHDDPAVVDALRLGALQPGDRLEDPVRHDDLARSLASGDRIDEPRPADLEVRHDHTDATGEDIASGDRHAGRPATFSHRSAPPPRPGGRGGPSGRPRRS